MEIVYSFIGCLLALFFHDILGKKPIKRDDAEVEPKKKQVNEKKFADMLYGQFVDKESKLYKTYIPIKTNRRGIDE